MWLLCVVLPTAAEQDVSKGEFAVDVSAKVFLLPPIKFQETLDLCEVLENADFKCPLEAGSYSETLEVPVPSIPLSVCWHACF